MAQDSNPEDGTKPVQFILNGEHVTLTDFAPHGVLIDYLHQADVGLAGPKLVCGEAGCGACTVMETVWDETEGAFVKRAINSCVRPLASLDGSIITTTEGIGSTRTGMDPVQYALAAHNGSQCGYCSAGFVMNMYTLLQNRPDGLTEAEIEQNFDGHICRCTGYRPILDGFKTFADDYTPPATPQAIEVAEDYAPIVKSLEAADPPPPHFVGYMKTPNLAIYREDAKTYARATDHETLTGILGEVGVEPQGTRLVSGNTSIGIYKPVSVHGETAVAPPNLVDVSRVKTMQRLDFASPEDVHRAGLNVGAGTTLSQLMAKLEHEIAEAPEGHLRAYEGILKHLKVVANHQVRAVGTVGGNIAMAVNHGFVSDVIVLFAALHARMFGTLHGHDGDHRNYEVLDIPTNADLGGMLVYAYFDLDGGIGPNWYFSSHKVRSRPDNAHAIVNNALSVEVVDGEIGRVSLVYNGLTPVLKDGALVSVGGNPAFHAVRMTHVEEALTGMSWDNSALQTGLDALDAQLDEILPTDLAPVETVTWAYRRSLARSLFFKAFVEISDQLGLNVPTEDASAAGPIQRGVSRGQQSYNDYPDVLPLSAPILKLSAFMQTTGEAEYIQTMGTPADTWEAAYVYSRAPLGTFRFVNTQGDTVTPDLLVEDLRAAGLSTLLGMITYDDVPNKAGNWAGMGADEPLFVPFEGAEIPAGILAAAEAQPTFQPRAFTSSGAPMALVFAKTREAARQLAAYIWHNHVVETPIDNPILTLDEARARKSIFENLPVTNPTMARIEAITRPGSNTDWLSDPKGTDLQGCTVVSGHHRTGAQNHFYLETQTTVAVPGENGAMTVHASTQNLADNQYGAAHALGVSANKVAVKLLRVGGGFGGKQMRTAFTSSAAAVAAAALNRPVRLMLDRNTNMIMQGNRHPFEADYSVAFDAKGRIHGLKVDFASDGGCTYDISFNVMDFVQLLAENVYDIPTWRTTGTVFRTNKISSTAYRGFGIIQCMNIMEGIIARVAHELDKPVEDVRAQNLYVKGRPVSGPFCLSAQALSAIKTMEILPDADFEKVADLAHTEYASETEFRAALSGTANLSPAQLLMILDMATQAHGFTPYMQPLDKFNLDTTYLALVRDPEYAERVKAVEAFNTTYRWKKRGLYSMPLKYGNAFTGPRGALNQGGAYVVAYSDDGSVLVRHGGVELGQGIQTQMAQIAAHTLGIPLDKIQMGTTTTEVVGDAAPTAASTASDLNGGAVELACKDLRARLEDMCRNLEQYSYRDIQTNRTPAEAGYKAMVEAVVNNWRTRWAECWDMIIALAFQNRINLASSARYAVPDYTAVDGRHPIGNPFLYHLYSAAVSEVELDVLTGEWNFIRADIRGDIGKSLNPLLDVGQMEGAFIQGLGYLTTEEMLWQTSDQAPIDGFDNGALLTYGTWAYKPPTINSIPEDFRVSIVNNIGETATGMNETGPAPADSGVKASKGASEFALVLANSAFYALHAAVTAARKDAGVTEWAELPAPATVPRLQTACNPNRDQFCLGD
ncbi:molybdopterin cofactor-binding domain-containing protein [uncultured Tateyamaria sp.]|uniref:molybdopterin cofactor-binding domain-containing protein n=1 Tax=uncultured Tateyamaria sp. TaxID=455651 RepID=UPI00260E4BA7|nr:molybdopterin cofactor-binding domain-containing protein [uncultured Tateyamaria sp.]